MILTEDRRTVTVRGAPVSYAVYGTGAPLVLIHGLAASSNWWRRNIDTLAAEYRTYLLDLPGFGAHRKLRKTFAVAAAAEWVISVLDALDVPTAALMGHSMGGLIALDVAVRAPERIDRLVLVSPAIGLTKKTVGANLLPLAAAVRYMQPAFLPTLARDAVRAGPQTVWRAARELLAFDAAEHLPTVRTPTLIVHGDRDPLVPLTVAQVLAESITGARVHVIAGVGHVPMFDRPDEFNRVVLRFLRGEDPDS